MRDSGLSIHFQDDNNSKLERKKDKSDENKPKEKEDKKPIKIEVNKKNNHLYRIIMIQIIVLTFEVIAIILLLPVILMGR